MAKTFKNLFGGYTTHGDDGTTYRTTKDAIGDGYTTHGSDGSTYKTHKRLTDDGYTTSKTSGGIGGELGSGIASFAIALVILQTCSSVLTSKSYICVAGVLIAPKLSGLCKRMHISGLWCSGVLFCFAAFSAIHSFENDISVVAGTRRGGDGLITLIVLFMILCVGLMFAMHEQESGTGFLSFFVLIISLAWSYLNTFANIPYTIHEVPFEHYFQSVIYILFTLLGQFAQCERYTWLGRIDCIVETRDYVYLFEFKRDESAERALKQIEEGKYDEIYAADKRKVFKIGVNFDSRKRMLDDWKVIEG